MEHNADQIDQVRKMNITDWLPSWWQLRSLADKFILLSIPLLWILFFVFKRKRLSQHFIVGIIVCMAGIIFWFVNAPDPRFGYGFLIPLIALLLVAILNERKEIPVGVIRLMVFLISAVALSYSVYRFKNFFGVSNIIQPRGIENTTWHQIKCVNIEFRIPDEPGYCNGIDPPCITGDCKNFEPRGQNPEDGFRAKKNADH